MKPEATAESTPVNRSDQAAMSHIRRGSTDYPTASKPFSSRPYGIILLSTLALSWVSGAFMLLIFVRNDNILNEGAGAQTLIFLGSLLFWLVFFLISGLIFLLWLYKVHQDLRFLFEKYPISPWGAIARFVIPIYSLYGMWDVLDEMRKTILPGFGIWIAAFYLLIVTQSVWNAARTIIENPEPISTPMLILFLASTTLYFLLTWKIHHALKGNFAGLAPNWSQSEELAAIVPVSQSSALDVRSQSSSPAQPGLDAMPAELVAIETPAVEAVTSADGGERRKSRRGWIFMGLLASILAICTVGACSLVTIGAYNILHWFDLSYWEYFLALEDLVAIDDSVSTATVEFSFIQDDREESELWLVVSLETPMNCRGGTAAACEVLVDEIAAFTLENYARIDEMDVLSVRMIPIDGDDADWSTPYQEKNLSIPEWREELGAAAI